MNRHNAAALWSVVLMACGLVACGQGGWGFPAGSLHAAEAPEFLKVETDFEPSGVRASLDGRFAVVWGRSFGAAFGGAGQKETHCVIIQLDSGRVVGRHKLPMRVSLVEIDDKCFYAVPEYESAILRAPHASFDKAKRIPLDAAPQRMWIHPDGSLVVWTSVFGDGNTKVLDRDTGEPKGDHPLSRLAFPVSGPWESGVSPLSGGLFQEEGAVLDARTFEVRCAGEVPMLIRVNNANQSVPLIFLGKEGQVGWGRGVDNGQLLDARKTELAKLPPGGGRLLRSFPLIPVLRGDDGRGGTPGQLEFRSAKTGELVSSVTLGSGAGWDSGLLLADAGERVVVAGRLGTFVVPIPETLKGTVPVPLHLQYPKVPVVTLDGPTTFDAIAVGGDGKRRFALANEADGLSIDPHSGRVTIDGRKLWERYQTVQLPKERSPGKASESSVGWAARIYRHFTREELPRDHFAATMIVIIAVSDEKNGYDTQFVCPIMKIPQSAVAKTAGTAPSAPPKNAPPAPPPVSKSAGPDREERMRKLEQGVGRAESTLEALEKRLRELERPRP